ncbi:MAG: hypothetical protein R3F14_09160 [Polyangiaceae bacterium]
MATSAAAVSVVLRSEKRELSEGGASSGRPLEAASKARAISLALAKRSVGTRANARAKNASSIAGREGSRRVTGAKAALSIAMATAPTDSPSKGRSPVRQR